MESLAVAVTHAVASSPSSVDLGVEAFAPPGEPSVGRWPGWARFAILVGGSAALWAGIGWAAFLILKLG